MITKRYYQENKITVEAILNELHHLQDQYDPSLSTSNASILLDQVMNSIQNIVDGLENGVQLSPGEKYSIYKEQQKELRKEDIISTLLNKKDFTEEMVEELSDEWFETALNYYDKGLTNDDSWTYAIDSAIDSTLELMNKRNK